MGLKISFCKVFPYKILYFKHKTPIVKVSIVESHYVFKNDFVQPFQAQLFLVTISAKVLNSAKIVKYL